MGCQNENIFVTEVTSESDTAVELKASTWTNDQFAELPAESGVEDGYVWASRTTYNAAQDDASSWTSKAVIATKIIGAEMTEMTSDGAEAGFHFELQPHETVYLVSSVGGGGQNYNNLGELQGQDPMAEAAELQQMVSSTENITSRKQASDEWWKEYWLKSYIDIGDEQLQRYYYGSLYYMGAGSREDALAPGIMGIWTTSDSTMWNGDYHMNYNYIAPFYGMYSSNRYEQAYSLKDPLLDYMPEGERRAKEDLDKVYYNYIHGGPGTSKSGVTFPGREDLLNGIDDAVLYPVSLGPWGIEPWTDSDGGYLMQVYNAAFSAQALTAYYAYTLDEAYMQEVYPLLLANASFYEKWCEKEDLGNGEYRYNVWSGGHEVEFDMNAGTTTGAIKNILQCLILAAENGHIGPPAEKLEKWIDMDEHMAEFPIEYMTVSGEQKPVFVLSEVGDKFRPEQATVNLEFIHPGEQLGFDSPAEWLEAAQNSVVQKEENNSGIWNQINNTPKIYLQAIRSGFDPQYVMDKFKIHLDGSMQENYTLYDGYHGIEKAGGIEFINNMLLQSSNGFIKVFPNWTNEDAGFTRLREKGAYVISSEMKDGQVQGVEITSEKGQDVKLVNPWGTENVVVTDSQGNEIEYQTGSMENSQEQTVEFAADENETYTIHASEETDPEKPVSKNTLEYFLNSAKEHVAAGDVENCVESVRNLFDEAIAEGEAVMADEDAAREEVMSSTVKLMKAIQALDMKAGNKTDLEMAVELGDMIDLSKYVEAGQQEFVDALAAAKEVLADGDAMQEEIDSAWNALVDAMSGLRLKADKDALEALLNEAAGLDLSQYTEESVSVFRSAFASAQAVLADGTLSEDDQQTVDEAVTALKSAKDGLTVKADNAGSGNENDGNNSGQDDGQAGGNAENSGNGSAQKAAKTGDVLPVVPVLLCVLSAGAILTVFRKKAK